MFKARIAVALTLPPGTPMMLSEVQPAALEERCFRKPDHPESPKEASNVPCLGLHPLQEESLTAHPTWECSNTAVIAVQAAQTRC